MTDAPALLDYLTRHADAMRADLRRLVDTESPSDDPTALTRCADELRAWVGELVDARTETVPEDAGPHLVVRGGADGEPYVLLIGHFDTVWPLGTVAARPYTEVDGVATGPGVFDMKAGLVQGMWALRAVAEVTGRLPAFRFVLNSDEEMQSHRSRPLIERHARGASVAFVLEPSERGALKTARKGVGRFTVDVHGRASHAGVDPTLGVSAVEELARITLHLQGLTDHAAGTTVNVGTVTGGTRPNVVPAHATAAVDVRVTSAAAGRAVEDAINAITPSRDGVTVDVTGGIVRPPMERSPATGVWFERAVAAGAALGVDVQETATGGGSDGNFCAALGVPVLDGLGAVGAGAHADDEHVQLSAVPERAALVAALLTET